MFVASPLLYRRNINILVCVPVHVWSVVWPFPYFFDVLFCKSRIKVVDQLWPSAFKPAGYFDADVILTPKREQV